MNRTKISSLLMVEAGLYVLGIIVVIIAVTGIGCRRAAFPGPSTPEIVPSRNPPLGPETISIGDRVQLHLGAEETLLRDGAVGLHYMPDIGVGVVDNEPGKLRLVFAAGAESYLVEGTDFKHLTSAQLVLKPDPASDFDNGDTGISQVIRAGGRLFAVYHAEDQRDIPSDFVRGVPGFYASVGLVESEDNGKTWVRRGQIIKGAKPKEWKAFTDPPPGHIVRGAGLPGAVISQDGRYAFLYYTDLSIQDNRGIQICMARADVTEGAPLPGRWKKFYKDEFSEPGVSGNETPVLSVLAMDEAAAMYPHVTWSEHLKKYVMVFNVNAWKEPTQGKPPKLSGIYWAMSDDAIKWSAITKLVTDYSYPRYGKSVSCEPTVIFDDREGKTGWLVYYYSPKWWDPKGGGIPHFMVGRRVLIRRSEP